MADDSQSSVMGRRKLPKRGPLVVSNPSIDSDEEVFPGPGRQRLDVRHGSNPYNPPPQASPTLPSPFSEQSSLPSTSYNSKSFPLKADIPEQSSSYAARSNPSLSSSSPSGSSSPAVESTPPPSTPGQSMSPDDGGNSAERPGCYNGDERQDFRHNAGGRMSVMDRLKQFPQHVLHKATRQTPSPINTSGTSYSPSTRESREAINHKVCITITADCDNFTYLDITGARNAAMIREKMFSKLQISDDQQPYFSVYRTEIGSFAMGEALSDDRLMDICRDEGDPRGSVKFLVQHSSATVHLPPPPTRGLVANHVPPVLPYQESFKSPSKKARSTKSNYETMSSASEPFVMDPVHGYEGSVSDELDQHERERHRNTIRPSPQQVKHSQHFGTSVPPSPLDHLRVGPSNIRDASPAGSRRAMSPVRTYTQDGGTSTTSSSNTTLMPDRSRGGTVTPTAPLTFSPSGMYFDDSAILSPPIRKTHAYSSSDAAAERNTEVNDRQMRPEQPDREARPGRKDDRRPDQGRRRPKGADYGESKRAQEPWVLVPSPSPSAAKNERPSTSDASTRSTSGIPKLVQHTTSASHSGPYPSDRGERYQPYGQGIYSSSRGHLPSVPVPPRGPPPPIPSSDNGRSHRQTGQAVPLHWAIKYVGDKGDQRPVQQPKPNRLLVAKSMDNLRINSSTSSSSSNQASRKPSQANLGRPSAAGLREASNASSASFMNMEPTPSRRDPQSAGLPKSYDSRTNFSPTTYTTSRQSSMNTNQGQGDYGQSPQSQYRPLPMQGLQSGSGANYLNAPSGFGWRQSPEELHPRPHSALDDIGASPVPTRPFRPLPTAGGNNSYVDVEAALDPEDSRSPRVSSPHHPYAASASQSMHSLNAVSSDQVSSKASGASSTTLAESASSSDTQTIIADSSSRQFRDSGMLPSPHSPRRTPLEIPDDFTQGSSDTPKSFVSIHDSPVYDGDNESGSHTLKSGDHQWVVSTYLTGDSSSDGTLKARDRGARGQEQSFPGSGSGALRLSKEASSSSVSTSRSTTTTDEGDEYETDGDDDDSGSLWKTPLKHQEPKRPNLVVDTEGGTRSLSSTTTATMIQRGSPNLAAGQQKNVPLPPIPPPNFPPPDFPPPTMAMPRPRKTPSGKGSRPNRESQFIKASQNNAMSRPAPEEIADNIEEYFPDHDVDKPCIDSSGGSSPTAAEPSVKGFQGSSAERDKKWRHKKSLRYVAHEGKKKIDRSSRSDDSSFTSHLQRRNTKLWGGKLEEVTTSQSPSIPAVPESPTNLNPKPIFKWVRGELIGKGTYGRVYLALNATTGEMIAVKQVEIPRTDADRDDKRQVTVVEALKLESETLKDLDHPNIVQYLGFEQTPDFLSIFLEYVPGGSVAACLRKHGKFDDQVSRSFTGQMLAGLEYLHNNGIIHRDVKADNILVDPSGICKISDFGISKRTEDINENGVHTSMQGSVFWMAPEVVQAARKGEKHGYNGKVDIWSLGCVVLEMWAGRRPWQDSDAIAVIYELITKQQAPPVPSDVVLGPDADDFRRKCFAIKPDERPSASELRLHPYLNLQPGWTFTGFK